MADARGFLFRKNLFLISFDLSDSKRRTYDYVKLDAHMSAIGVRITPTKQIRLLVHRGDAGQVRDSLRAAAYLRGPRAGKTVLTTQDKVFVMKLVKSAAWNNIQERDLTKWAISAFT